MKSAEGGYEHAMVPTTTTCTLGRRAYSLPTLNSIGNGLMVFNTTFNNISAKSWRSMLLVEETGAPGQNYQFPPQ